jgi:hypothetical protein
VQAFAELVVVGVDLTSPPRGQVDQRVLAVDLGEQVVDGGDGESLPKLKGPVGGRSRRPAPAGSKTEYTADLVHGAVHGRVDHHVIEPVRLRELDVRDGHALGDPLLVVGAAPAQALHQRFA